MNLVFWSKKQHNLASLFNTRHSISSCSILTLCFITLLIGCGTEEKQTTVYPERPIKFIEVGKFDSPEKIELPGSVKANRETQVAFEVSGKLVEILVIEGDIVAKGQLLARLDPREYASALDRAKAQKDSAELDYQRYLTASRSNAVTQQMLDSAKTNLDVAIADWETAQKALEDAELKSPFNGRVAKKIVADFSNVQSKQAIFILHDESGFEVEVSISERDWAVRGPDTTLEEISNELDPEVRILAFPSKTFPAQAKSFSTAIDPVTRTYRATFAFQTPSENTVSAGMTALLIIKDPSLINSDANRFLIPLSAVISKPDGKIFVWLIDHSNIVSKRPVELGKVIGNQVEIVSGLSTGDKIAIRGVHSLTENQEVIPVN